MVLLCIRTSPKQEVWQARVVRSMVQSARSQENLGIGPSLTLLMLVGLTFEDTTFLCNGFGGLL